MALLRRGCRLPSEDARLTLAKRHRLPLGLSPAFCCVYEYKDAISSDVIMKAVNTGGLPFWYTRVADFMWLKR